MKKTALILVDIQNDYFPGGKFEQEGAELSANNAAKTMEKFREQKMPVIHIRHESLKENAGFFQPGTHGAELHDSVTPVEGEKTILKHFPNSFRETDLEQELHSIGVERVVIAGMMTFMCIDATARAANDLGFDVVVLGDACAACSLEFQGVKIPAFRVHAAFLAALEMVYADVVNTDVFIKSL